MEKSLSL